MKRLLLLFALILAAAYSWADASGTCGDGVTYVYTESDQTLTISKTGEGTGKMTDYFSEANAPWFTYSYRGKLLKVEIIFGVTSIGKHAFSGCRSITSVTIPNSVTSIGNSAFYYCSGLASVKVESGNTMYDSRDNCNAIIETGTNTLILGTKNTVIPNSVTIIGKSAFGGCSGLTSITIPNSVTSIGDGAFLSCSGLTSITIPNSVTIIGISAFGGCSSLTSITIPNSVTSIGNLAFYDCSSLTSITIPNSVTSIGNSAFYDCSSLTSITIPISVTSIKGDAFMGCKSLSSILVEGGNPVYDSRNNCNAIIQTSNNELLLGCKNTKIPDSVTSIGDRAFSGCSSLTSITIPNSVTSIGGDAFAGCSGLTSVTVRNSTPPALGNGFWGAFGSSTYSNAKLYVPIGSKEAYAAADYWKNFKEIIEIEMAESVVTGDANGDGMVDAADVVAIVNKILDKSGDNFNEKAADVNGDGVIDVSDVVAVVNIILRD